MIGPNLADQLVTFSLVLAVDSLNPKKNSIPTSSKSSFLYCSNNVKVVKLYLHFAGYNIFHFSLSNSPKHIALFYMAMPQALNRSTVFGLPLFFLTNFVDGLDSLQYTAAELYFAVIVIHIIASFQLYLYYCTSVL